MDTCLCVTRQTIVITFFCPGEIPGLRVDVMTKRQQSIHHPNYSALLREEKALNGEPLTFSVSTAISPINPRTEPVHCGL